jgi:mitochondrial fission protein ELM1
LTLTAKPLTIWRLTDGKPGHDNQSLGLARAMAALAACKTYDIPVSSAPLSAVAMLLPGSGAATSLPDPDLIIGAGHGTHLPLLCAAKRRGGRTVVLMRPSLPASWFDLCLIPEHDGAITRGNILATRGALNTMVPSSSRAPGRGMILIGGVSRHYRWDDRLLARQLERILAGGGYTWLLTDSPRTPAGTREMLASLRGNQLSYRSCTNTPRGWLAGELAATECAWVTEDSVSMLYEALSAGAATGVLEMPARRHNKIYASVKKLADEGLVTTFKDWQAGRNLSAPRVPFNEAARCAGLVLSYFALPVQ